MSDEFKHIDDHFRNKFKDFELDPPDHVWGKIKAQMHGSGNGGNGNNYKKGGIYGISIIIIVAGILSWYLLSSSDNAGEKLPQNGMTQIDNTKYKSSTRMIAINADGEVENELDKNLSNRGSSINNKNKQKARFDISQPAVIAEGKKSLLVQKNAQSSNILFSEDIKVIDNHESSDILITGTDKELLAINDTFETNAEIAETATTTNAESAIVAAVIEKENKQNIAEAGLEKAPELRSDYGQKGKWMFGLFFTPEMIFYPDNNSLNNRTYSLDINAFYKFSGYFLQSGIGASWTSDEGNCEIDYNEYLGSYDQVYDVTFDTIGNELNPIYHTEPVKVYDTIDHVSIMPTKNHYTYLQFPVLFGYGKENRRFGWFVKGGPSLSIMIHEDIATNNMSGTEDKILSIENEIPSRIKTNWQFVFAGGVSYKLSNHLNITAEPVFRYYLNPTYERSNVNLKNPYSMGLRIGFLLEL